MVGQQVPDDLALALAVEGPSGTSSAVDGRVRGLASSIARHAVSNTRWFSPPRGDPHRTIEIRETDAAASARTWRRALSTVAGAQVVVTRTVRDLAAGTDLRFALFGSTAPARAAPRELIAAAIQQTRLRGAPGVSGAGRRAA